MNLEAMADLVSRYKEACRVLGDKPVGVFTLKEVNFLTNHLTGFEKTVEFQIETPDDLKATRELIEELERLGQKGK